MRRDRAGKGDQKRAHKLAWFTRYGYMEDDAWHHRCQSCGRPLSMSGADFSHKVPAGRGGDKGREVIASNGIASCRACHEWLERGTEAQEARAHLIASSASLENDEVVEWTETLRASLYRWLRG